MKIPDNLYHNGFIIRDTLNPKLRDLYEHFEELKRNQYSEQITIRIYKKTIDWFKNNYKNYQTYMKIALRSLVTMSIDDIHKFLPYQDIKTLEKKKITIRIDKDILDKYKSYGKNYQSMINDALYLFTMVDEYAEEHKWAWL